MLAAEMEGRKVDPHVAVQVEALLARVEADALGARPHLVPRRVVTELADVGVLRPGLDGLPCPRDRRREEDRAERCYPSKPSSLQGFGPAPPPPAGRAARAGFVVFVVSGWGAATWSGCPFASR